MSPLWLRPWLFSTFDVIVIVTSVFKTVVFLQKNYKETVIWIVSQVVPTVVYKNQSNMNN